MKPQRTFNASVGQYSVDNQGPEVLGRDIDNINKMFDPSTVFSNGEKGGIGEDNLKFNLRGDLADNGSVAGHTSGAEQIGSKVIADLKDPDVPTNPALTIWKQIKSLVLLILDRDSKAAHLAGSETITGLKAFTQPVSVATPTADGHATTKGYVDTKDTDLKAYADHTFVTKATAEAISGVKTFTASPIIPVPSAATNPATKKYVDDADALKADASLVYTKTNLQTSGQSVIHWGNIINAPNIGDQHWKPPVANKAALPLTGNLLQDVRTVLDDGDGKQAVYVCIATTGTVNQQWSKIADVDWQTEEATRVTQENARISAESGRVSAESARVTSESNRVYEESVRATNEGLRNMMEDLRQSIEASRASAESGRASAESSRVGAETSRATAESDRVTVEANRVTAENGRVAAELLRVTAENNRNVFEPYNTTKTYVSGNKVTTTDGVFLCKATVTGVAPPNGTYWQLIMAPVAGGGGTVPDNVLLSNELNTIVDAGKTTTFLADAHSGFILDNANPTIGKATFTVGTEGSEESASVFSRIQDTLGVTTAQEILSNGLHIRDMEAQPAHSRATQTATAIRQTASYQVDETSILAMTTELSFNQFKVIMDVTSSAGDGSLELVYDGTSLRNIGYENDDITFSKIAAFVGAGNAASRPEDPSNHGEIYLADNGEISIWNSDLASWQPFFDGVLQNKGLEVYDGRSMQMFTGAKGSIPVYNTEFATLASGDARWSVANPMHSPSYISLNMKASSSASIQESLTFTKGTSTYLLFGQHNPPPDPTLELAETPVTLLSGSWTGSGPYAYTIMHGNVTSSTTDQEIIPAPSITTLQLKALSDAMLIGYSQSAGSFVVYAHGTKPAIDIPIIVTVKRRI